MCAWGTSTATICGGLIDHEPTRRCIFSTHFLEARDEDFIALVEIGWNCNWRVETHTRSHETPVSAQSTPSENTFKQIVRIYRSYQNGTTGSCMKRHDTSGLLMFAVLANAVWSCVILCLCRVEVAFEPEQDIVHTEEVAATGSIPPARFGSTLVSVRIIKPPMGQWACMVIGMRIDDTWFLLDDNGPGW